MVHNTPWALAVGTIRAGPAKKRRLLQQHDLQRATQEQRLQHLGRGKKPWINNAHKATYRHPRRSSSKVDPLRMCLSLPDHGLSAGWGWARYPPFCVCGRGLILVGNRHQICGKWKNGDRRGSRGRRGSTQPRPPDIQTSSGRCRRLLFGSRARWRKHTSFSTAGIPPLAAGGVMA